MPCCALLPGLELHRGAAAGSAEDRTKRLHGPKWPLQEGGRLGAFSVPWHRESPNKCLAFALPGLVSGCP